MMETKRFLNVSDVATYMDISESMAYKIIRRLNGELKNQGFITVAGKVNRTYFERKIFDAQSA